MSKLHTMEDVVLQVLEECPVAREDDYILYAMVCARESEKTVAINGEYLTKPFLDVMLGHKVYRMPNWETVTRCRRKIQEKRPDLVSPEKAKKRHKEEEVYREYART